MSAQIGRAAAEEASVVLAREDGGPARARAFVAQRLGPRVDYAVRGDAMLIASELVSNALRHGRGQIELSLSHRGERLRIEVTDEGSGADVRPRGRGDGSGGWGLHLVQSLAERWGAGEGTTCVWAELALR